MKFLNILSSHYDQAFNNVLLKRFEDALEKHGYDYESIDLYKIKFNPVMHGDDFNQFMGKELPKEIRTYQKQVQEADVLAFFYPVWWCDMPAIMKGWIDRVFTKGFAYDYGEAGTKGLLSGKKAILISTFGNSLDSDEAKQIDAAMKCKSEFGIFKYCAFDTVHHHHLYDVYASDEKRQEYLELMDKLAAGLIA